MLCVIFQTWRRYTKIILLAAGTLALPPSLSAVVRGQAGASVETEETLYAKSANGLHWVKPHWGLAEFRGNHRNNIVAIDLISNTAFATERNARNSARLEANVELAGEGSVGFELLDRAGMPVPGYSAVVENSRLSVPANWKDKKSIPPGNYRLRARLERHGAESPKLYAFYVTREITTR